MRHTAGTPRWPILLASCAFPAFFLYFFAQERVYAPPATPDIVYITSFAPDRSEDEIIASNIANQERKEARQRLLDAQLETRRDMYRALRSPPALCPSAISSIVHF